MNSGELKGVLTDRDILVRCVANGGGLGADKISAHMTSPVVSISPQTDVFEAVRTMRNHGVQRLPVEEGGKLAGIVSMGDIAQAMDEPIHDLVIGSWAHSERATSLVGKS